MFEEQGFEETTLRAVAARAGVGLGTIFVHFPDKRALLTAALEEDVAAVLADAIGSLPAKPFRQQLVHLAGALYRFYARRPGLARALVENMTFAEGPARDRMLTQVEAFLGYVEGLATAGMERGELRADLDPGDAALGFWADYFIGLVGGLQRPELGVEGQLELLERLVDLRLRGMAVPGGSPRERSKR
jgi:AcrR family transcriptional regulator